MKEFIEEIMIRFASAKPNKIFSLMEFENVIDPLYKDELCGKALQEIEQMGWLQRNEIDGFPVIVLTLDGQEFAEGLLEEN